MPLSDYQFQYKTLVFGASTIYDVKEVRGELWGLTVKDGDRDFTRFHGQIPGEMFIASRTFEVDVEVRGDPLDTNYWDDVEEFLETFLARPLLHDTDDKFIFKTPEYEERFLRCRTIRRQFDRSWRTEFGLAPITVQMKAADPRIYSTTFHTSGSQSGTFNVTNNGNANAYPRLTFSQGGTVELINNTYPGTPFEATGLTAGTLIADMDEYIRGKASYILTVGGANQYGMWVQPRRPFVLGQGVNSLTLVSGTNVTVEHYDTWL